MLRKLTYVRGHSDLAPGKPIVSHSSLDLALKSQTTSGKLFFFHGQQLNLLEI